jgi:predicted transcriptional regulator
VVSLAAGPKRVFIHPAVHLRTLELYEQYMSCETVGSILGVSDRTVSMRLGDLGLKLPPGQGPDRKLEDVNDPVAIEAVKRRLRTKTVHVSAHQLRTPATYLQTMELYLEHQSVKAVARILGLTPGAIHYRLRDLGLTAPWESSTRTVEERHGADFIRGVVERLRSEVATDTTTLAERRNLAYRAPLTSQQKLETLELYIELQSAQRVAARLGLSAPTVKYRIESLGLRMRPVGRNQPSFEDANGTAAIQRVRDRLRAAIEQEQSVDA